MKCKWCGKEVYLWRDELGGGMINDEETGQPHSCEVFADWLESKNLHGPTLSSARYELWRIGPEEANKRRDLQEESKKPTLLWNAIFPSGKK